MTRRARLGLAVLAWFGLATAFAVGHVLAWLVQDLTSCFPFIKLWR